MRNYLVAGIVASVLCACGGGGSTPDPVVRETTSPVAPNASVSPPTPSSTPVVSIVAYGDDQMEGDGANSSNILSMVTPSEPQALQTLLQHQFNDTGIAVLNDATGGTSSSLQNELDGMDGLGAAQPARMETSGAQIVIEQHMLNDALGGETVAEYAAYLGQWVQDARASGIQPVLEEDSPVCDGNHPQLPSYVAAMDSIAAQYSVPIIHQYAYVESLPNWQAHMIGCTVPDAYLATLKAAQEEAVIGPLVRALVGI